MKMIKYLPAIVLVLLLKGSVSVAQEQPIGYWRSLLPYNTALGIATDGITLFTITQHSFFTYNISTGDMIPYSKVDGMSDVDMACIGYDAATATTVLAYTNSNIDLFKDNTFYNIPDIKLASVAGSKNINSIYTENGFAYLSSDLGIVVLDLTNKNIKETYHFSYNNQDVPITGFTGQGNYFYAINANGLYRITKTNPQIQNSGAWQRLDSTHVFTGISAIGAKLYLSNSDSLYTFYNDTLRGVYGSSLAITHTDAGNKGIWVSESNATYYNGVVRLLDSTNYNVIDSFHTRGLPVSVVQTFDSSVWVSDVYNGMCKRTGTDNIGFFYPAGPAAATNFDIYAYNKNIWVAHGSYTDKLVPGSNKYGISNFQDGQWHIYREYNYGPFSDTMADFCSIVKDETNGTVYSGSFRGGLFELHQDGSYQIYKQSVFESSQPNVGWYQVFGLALDHEYNLWATLYGSPHQLYVKTKDDGTWHKMSVPYRYLDTYPFDAGPMIVDDNDQEWFLCPNGGGVIAYNDNGTPADPTDDVSQQFITGVGNGNLPSGNTLSIACDKNGDIWVGTNDGIGIISCANSITEGICDANIPIVQYDAYAGYLFKGENVRTIAVDGANRKWVGTDNGVWLLSPDASKQIYHFTKDNSPLPSNHLIKIAIDPITGDVYFGTDDGLVSFRGTATEGTETNSNVLVFPNPVTSGYKGEIAIRGLVANADVRITDMSGQLVYRTIANGGQAVWNGLDYTGHRPESGVYLIFVTNKDGSQTYVSKMVFMQ